MSHQRPIIVQKYGGSSVADVEKIGRVADRVVAAARDGNAVVVVVSAMGKTTDGLISLAHSAAMVAGTNGASPTKTDPARRELDMLVSTGERVSMSLLSIAIQARGFPAISFTGSQSGILTNDRHFDARIIEVRPHRIEDELARGNIVIVAGYQGMSYKREITTLGRGGSDTTAVALAAALSAERCEIYSDVDGVYSADPRVVKDARHLPAIDHSMLQEMAEAGAKVVCAQAVEWAQKSGITIHARSTFDQNQARETVVRAASSETIQARAVASETKLLFVSYHGQSLNDVIASLSRAELPFKDLSCHGASGSLIVPLLNVTASEAAGRSLGHDLPNATIRRDAATVSVIGDGLAGSARPLERFVNALTRANVDIAGTACGPLRLTAVVPLDRVEDAQRAIHDELVTQR